MSIIAKHRGIEIVIRTRDEHCEPHVHAYHSEQGWELRVFFSYISDEITDVELLYGRSPKKNSVQAVMNKVIDHLDKARELFWLAVQTVCLENKYIIVVDGVVYAAQQGEVGAVRVTAARYISAAKSIEVELYGSSARLIAKCP